MSELFISYSRKNKAFVQQLVSSLKDHDLTDEDIWVDWQDIPPNAEWWREIQQGIESANNFLFVISPASLLSTVCADELSHAIANGKRLVPIVYEEPGKEATLSDALARLNWIYFRTSDNFAQAVQTLVETLNTDLDYKRTHTRLTVRAQEWVRSENNSSFLLRGDDLIAAEKWLTQSRDDRVQPTPLQSEYIFASRSANIRRQRITVGLLALGLVVTLALAIFALIQRQAALDSAAISQSLALAANAQMVVNDDPVLAVGLAAHANQMKRPPNQSQQVLAEIAYAPGIIHFLPENDVSSGRAFSPDGQVFLTHGINDSLILYDSQNGQEVQRIQGYVYGALSPDGETMLVQSTTNNFALLNLVNEQTVREFGEADYGAFSADGTLLLTYSPVASDFSGVPFILVNPDSMDETDEPDTEPPEDNLFIWETETGVLRYSMHIPGLRSAVLNPTNDGILMVTNPRTDASPEIIIASGANMYLMNPDTGEKQGFGGKPLLRDAMFSPDGRVIFSHSLEGTLTLWDALYGPDVYSIQPRSSTIASMTISQDGRMLVTAWSDGNITIWSLDAALEAENEVGGVFRRLAEVMTLGGDTGAVTGLAISPDGRYLLSGSSQGTMLWDLENGAIIRRFNGFYDEFDDSYLPVAGVGFRADGTTAIAVSDEQTLKVYDTTGYEGSHASCGKRDLAEDEDGILHITGVQIMNVGEDDHGSHVEVLDLETCDQQLFNLGDSSNIAEFSGAIMNHAGDQLLIGMNDGRVIVWSADSEDELAIIEASEAEVTSIAFSPDDRYFAVGYEDGSLILGETVSWSAQRRFAGHEGIVTSLEFAIDSNRILSGSLDMTVRLWDIDENLPIHQLNGHTGGVTSVAFSPDNLMGISSSHDQSLIMWDLISGEELRRLTGHDTTVTHVAWSPDGHMLFSGSTDGRLVLWRVDSLDSLVQWTQVNRHMREFTCEERKRFNIEPDCG